MVHNLMGGALSTFPFKRFSTAPADGISIHWLDFDISILLLLMGHSTTGFGGVGNTDHYAGVLSFRTGQEGITRTAKAEDDEHTTRERELCGETIRDWWLLCARSWNDCMSGDSLTSGLGDSMTGTWGGQRRRSSPFSFSLVPLCFSFFHFVLYKCMAWYSMARLHRSSFPFGCFHFFP